MKTCPQCEFLYEDDQRLCDMDGVKLVVDSRKLPNLNALAVNTPAVNPTWRSRTVPLLAGLVLATVLYLVYQVQIQPTRVVTGPPASSSPAQHQLSPVPAVTTEASQPNAASETSRSTAPAGDSSEVKETAATPKLEPVKAPASPKRASEKPAPTLVPSKKAKAKKPTANAVSGVVSPKKNDSKIESFLKKTGKMFKKPFTRK
jgi:hypothetical protein